MPRDSSRLRASVAGCRAEDVPVGHTSRLDDVVERLGIATTAVAVVRNSCIHLACVFDGRVDGRS